MDFRVLGALEIQSGTDRLTLPGARHRRVLACLLLSPNSVVPLPKLIEATWDGEPPATATKQIQNCVSVLRERLGDAKQQLIVTDGSGYRITVDHQQVDWLRFVDAVANARQSAEGGALVEGVEKIRSALKLWRGPVLDGLDAAALAGRAARLEEQRLNALELCIDWQLKLGQHREVVDELAEIVEEHPLRERPYAQLMLALDRSGRQADALAVFQRLRTQLAEELGVDPGAEVRRLHEQILRGETEEPAAAEPVRVEQPSSQLDRAAEELAAAIVRQWTAETEIRSLHRPEPVPLTWTSTERPVAAAASAVLGRPGNSERLTFSGDLTDVVAKFRQVPARQLVVLGEPGAGKSVLAILLTLGLLADPPPGEPVPVLLPLSSWNPREEHLHGWLARRLVEEYPGLANTGAYGKGAALRLVLEGRIIPVLDGLDELAPGLHTAAIDALDQAVSGGRPLVVTCRSTEYEFAVRQSGTFLSRAAVVEIEPVETEDAIDFLTARQRFGETRWEPVVRQLRRNPESPLAQALRTPLMVDLARTAYAHPSTDPGELCDSARFPGRAAIEGHLLDEYLPVVYTSRPAPPARLDRPTRPRDYPAEQAQRWLSFFARQLERDQSRDLAWWQLDRAVPRLVLGLCLGLPPAVLFALTGWIAAGPAIGAIYGLSFAVAGCVTHTVGSRPGPLRVEARFRGTAGRFLRRFAVGVLIGVCLGLAWSLSAGVIALLAVVFGLAIGVHVWLDTPVEASRVSSPASVLRNDRAATLLFTLSFIVSLGLFYGMAFAFTKETRFLAVFHDHYDLALAFAGGLAAALLGRFLVRSPGSAAYGIAGAIIGGQVFSRASSTTQAVAAGIMFGLAVGLSVWIARAWGAYTFSRLWLASRKRIPLDLMGFLDDAHRRGVLRQVGEVYQFRHARLQERLAADPA